MDPSLAATLVLAFVVLGEVLSIKSRARIPALLVTMLGLFVFVKIGFIPEDVVEASAFTMIAAVMTPALMVHMGTLIPLKSLKEQWRAVLIAVGGMIGATALILGVVGTMFSYSEAVAGAGPLVGGIVSTLVTVDGLKAAGMTSAIVIPSLILVLQSLPSMPLTAFLLRKYVQATHVVGTRVEETVALASGTSSSRGGSTVGTALADSSAAGSGDAGGTSGTRTTATAGTDSPTDASGTGKSGRRKLLQLPEAYRDNPFVLLLILVATGAAANGLEALTGVSYSIWGIAFGFTLVWLGVLPDKAMERANAFTIGILGIMMTVTAPLMHASIQQVIASLGVVAAIIVVGLAGIVIGGLVVSKLVGMDLRLGTSVALTATFGFPGDYLISNEVARSLGRDEADRQRILDRILPPMLIGGFTSVSAGSIVIATVLVGTL